MYLVQKHLKNSDLIFMIVVVDIFCEHSRSYHISLTSKRTEIFLKFLKCVSHVNSDCLFYIQYMLRVLVNGQSKI